MSDINVKGFLGFIIQLCKDRYLTDPFYTKKNIYSDFMRGVLGVLQGGLESAELADRDSIDLYHNHTINDIIEECKNRREFEDGENRIELCTFLTEAIQEQEEEINKAWELVCKSFNEIRKTGIHKIK